MNFADCLGVEPLGSGGRLCGRGEIGHAGSHHSLRANIPAGGRPYRRSKPLRPTEWRLNAPRKHLVAAAQHQTCTRQPNEDGDVPQPPRPRSQRAPAQEPQAGRCRHDPRRAPRPRSRAGSASVDEVGKAISAGDHRRLIREPCLCLFAGAMIRPAAGVRPSARALNWVYLKRNCSSLSSHSGCG